MSQEVFHIRFSEDTPESRRSIRELQRDLADVSAGSGVSLSMSLETKGQHFLKLELSAGSRATVVGWVVAWLQRNPSLTVFLEAPDGSLTRLPPDEKKDPERPKGRPAHRPHGLPDADFRLEFKRFNKF